MTRTPPLKPLMVLSVAIVGGGPSGLILCTALRLRGVRATVFERQSGPAQGGGGVNLMQPAITVLKQEGLWDGPDGVGGCNEPSTHFYFHDAKANAVVRAVNLASRYGGEPYCTVRRCDVTEALLARLPPGEPIRYGEDVTGADAENGRLQFRDGSFSDECFDVVVGADGIGSNLRKGVLFERTRLSKESASVNIIGIAEIDKLRSGEPMLAAAFRDRCGMFTVHLDPAVTFILATVTKTHALWSGESSN